MSTSILSVAGYGDEGKGVRRYHVLAAVHLMMTVKSEFLVDWEEAERDPAHDPARTPAATERNVELKKAADNSPESTTPQVTDA
jgi:hypothetical protein